MRLGIKSLGEESWWGGWKPGFPLGDLRTSYCLPSRRLGPALAEIPHGVYGFSGLNKAIKDA